MYFYHNSQEYRIAGNFEGENFHGFQGLTAIHKSFLHEIWGHAAPTYDWFQAIRESFLCEILTFYGSAKVFRYTVLSHFGTKIPLYLSHCLFLTSG